MMKRSFSVLLGLGFLMTANSTVLHSQFLPTLRSAMADPGDEVEEEDQTEIEKKLADLKKNQDGMERLKGEIESAKKDDSLSFDEREKKVANLQLRYDYAKQQVSKLTHILTATNRKAEKIDRDRSEVDSIEKEIQALIDSRVGKSDADILPINQEILSKSARRQRLLKRIGRKEKAYEKKAGESLADSRRLNKKVEPPAPAPVVTDEELRKNPACWERSSTPMPSKLYVTYPKGDKDLLRGDSSPEQKRSTEQYEEQINQFIAQFNKSEYQKIWKVEAASRTSRVMASQNKSSESLAAERSNSAINYLFDVPLLAEDGTPPRANLKTDDAFDAVDLSLKEKPDAGPPWPNPYFSTPAMKARINKAGKGLPNLSSKLSATPVDDDEIIMMARELHQGKFKDEPTPVRGKDLAETTENLRICCGTDLYSLYYRPYQSTKITVYGAKFNKALPECVMAANPKVNNSVGQKPEDLVDTSGKTPRTSQQKAGQGN